MTPHIDDRIRELVRAAADNAPSPPPYPAELIASSQIDGDADLLLELEAAEPVSQANRWILLGAAVALVVALVAATLALDGSGQGVDESVVDPAPEFDPGVEHTRIEMDLGLPPGCLAGAEEGAGDSATATVTIDVWAAPAHGLWRQAITYSNGSQSVRVHKGHPYFPVRAFVGGSGPDWACDDGTDVLGTFNRQIVTLDRLAASPNVAPKADGPPEPPTWWDDLVVPDHDEVGPQGQEVVLLRFDRHEWLVEPGTGWTAEFRTRGDDGEVSSRRVVKRTTLPFDPALFSTDDLEVVYDRTDGGVGAAPEPTPLAGREIEWGSSQTGTVEEAVSSFADDVGWPVAGISIIDEGPGIALVEVEGTHGHRFHAQVGGGPQARGVLRAGNRVTLVGAPDGRIGALFPEEAAMVSIDLYIHHGGDMMAWTVPWDQFSEAAVDFLLPAEVTNVDDILVIGRNEAGEAITIAMY